MDRTSQRLMIRGETLRQMLERRAAERARDMARKSARVEVLTGQELRAGFAVEIRMKGTVVL